MERRQFTLGRMLWAIAWVAVGLAVWRLSSPFNVHGFLDDDPDNIMPRVTAAFTIVPIAGAAGALRGRPLLAAAIALGCWALATVAIFAIGLLRLF